MTLWNQLRLRPRLLTAVIVGSALAAAWPDVTSLQTRLLIGWNLVIWIYLPLVLWMMFSPSTTADVQARARRLNEGVPVVLLLAVLGALASLAAITLELQAARQNHDTRYVLLALATVAGSWLLLPVEFGLAYASLYHRQGKGRHGLEFPGDDELPDYADFLYFSITVAATSQTSDVVVSAKPMRRLVLLQALIAFVFNTGVLALSINILAGLIS
ncbi:DUF1345 domain-containing protein [Roseateles puraquae]|jgi:uncharacterized membrane protein|uniref:DUF1345 domain-containing protein n=1 Tax=Roseateles puraquae TaxID=431059 RepID=A0A254NGM4_9BURK|nr:DUF1345 domain-containing protein [Roseateles puraquae]MDG0852665.1 DUF1345 domain-containing protein [Roseateles puraquae]OWR05377.1 hypothetical protein CDO81_02625 [Roseateles puraquae]